MRKLFFFLLVLAGACVAHAQSKYILLKPDRVFDGENMQTGWVVLVKNNLIEQAGPMLFKLPAGSEVIELKGMTLLPGLIEGHSHLLLHPYNETSWDDQVLKEPLALRIVRAVKQAEAGLKAGFTTTRDLGTEGAGDADVGLKQAFDQGLVPGPRLVVVTRAIVATGSYGPKGFAPGVRVPQGADEADGGSALRRTVRDQI